MKKIIFAVLILLMPLASHALLEIRAGYGINTFDDDDYQGAELSTMTGFNLDVIFEPPLLTDLGLGVRYETMGFDLDALGANIGEADMTRVSALINYRIIDFIAYFGVIGTIGLSTDFETNIGGTVTTYDEKFNYTLGVEGGMNLGIFSVGAEVGKFFAKFEDPGNPDADLESVYVKALFGIDF